MRPSSKRLILLAVGLVIAASIIAPHNFVAHASNPHLAFYSSATDRILWFIHTADTHIGTSGSADSDSLRWLVTTGKNVIKPSFIVVAGDLTDSTNGNIFGYPNGPYQSEWDEYKSIVDPNVDASFYYDIPGNHDAYNDKYFAYYLANSVQGRATHSTQVSWSRTLTSSGDTYHFLGVNTADNTGASFSLAFPYGDHAGLDTSELSFVNSDLNANQVASLTLAFGHHPVTDTGVSGDTWLFYGQTDFIHDLDIYKGSEYGYGHTHRYSQAFYKGNSYTGPMSEGIAYNSVASLGKSSSNNYSVVAIDCNGVSSVGATPGTWPVVLITAPVNALIGTATNPYAYSVPAASTNPIRALVFDTATPQVAFRIDGGATWYSMTQVAAGSPVWQGTWNASTLTSGNHTIEVRAIGTTTVSNIVTASVTGGNPPPPTTDTVTIKSATYTKRNRTLSVQATSSAQPNATLTVVGFGQMTYSSKSKTYTYQAKVSSAPANVTVSSSQGGSATQSVTLK